MLGHMETPFKHFFSDRIYPGTLDELTRGPLAAHLKTYAQQLCDEGYAIQTGQCQLRMLGHFNRWLQNKGFAADEIDSSTVKRFVRFRGKTAKLHKGATAALVRMLRMLRAGQAVPLSPPTPCQTILERFQHYLRQERGLSEATIMRQTPIVRALLAEVLPAGIPDFHQISASDIAGFVQRQAERITTKSAPTVVTALRSFFRHLLHRGAIETDMAVCVPTDFNVVAIGRAEVPSCRADPTCFGLLRSEHRDWQAQLRHSASVGASGTSRRRSGDSDTRRH